MVGQVCETQLSTANRENKPLRKSAMNPLVRRIQMSQSCLQRYIRQFRSGRPDEGSSPPARRRRPKFSTASLKKIDDTSEWWAVDGEMHEIGENVPPRERFVIPRDNIPNRHRKHLRHQFMRRTRLVLKDSEEEPWCKRYMELYQELRENWERLYWDEGYSNKLGQDHANYESAEDDDQDFSPYRSSRPFDQMKGEGIRRNIQDDGWGKVNQIRDKFEYDREKRMREKAFAPMDRGTEFDMNRPVSKTRPLDSSRRYNIPQLGRR